MAKTFDEWHNETYNKKKKKTTSGDIAPVRKTNISVPVKSTTPAAKKSISAPSWFQKSEYFKDGSWDKGDLTKTILGSLTDVGEHGTTGYFEFFEKAGKGALALGNAMAMNQRNANASSEMISTKMMGGNPGDVLKRNKKLDTEIKKDVAESVETDWYDGNAIAKKIITNPVKEKTGVDAETASVFGTKSDELVQAAGGVFAGKTLGTISAPLGIIGTGMSAGGGEMEEALKNGANYDEALLSGTITGVAEGFTEKIFNGIKFGGGETLTDATISKMASVFSNKALQSLAKYGINVLGEGAEETLSDFISSVGKKFTYLNDKEIKEIYSSQDAWDSFIGGAILGSFFEGVDVVGSKVKGKNYVTGYNKSEQTVFDKVVEDRIAEKTKDGKKLTPKEKLELREAVKNDLEKGYISVDMLESILGGETYNSYKSLTEKENSLQNEFNTLNQMKQGDMTGEQLDRRAELKKQLEELKNDTKKSELKDKLSNDVFNLAKDSRLVESYNEKARKSQAFKADLSKYDTAQQETIKKAVDSGILNNTNRTHEFVDMLAKISADKGVLFDFTSNEKLKNSSFALEGKTVNGYVTGDGNVAVNVDSSKSLNTVVGHEITHILEGTELYDALQQSIVAYAKAKGDYDGRYKSIEKLYEGIEGADINKELTADLVGDYLFTDENFIRSLSTEQPGVFKKVYDEIKYLCKVATAGSKEARELEKIKKTFSDIYRDSGKAQKNTTEDGGVKYSIKKTSKIPYISQIEQIESQKLNGSNSIYIGVPSTELQSAGFSNNPFAMNQADYRKSRRKSTPNKNYSKHGVKRKVFEQLPQKLNEAVMFIDNGKKVTVVTDSLMVDTNGQPSYIVAGVWKNQPMDNDTVNIVKSVYPLDDFIEQITKSADNGTLVITDKNKANDLLAPIGIQPSQRSKIISLAKDSISQYSEKSSDNKQYSLSATDNKYMDAVNRGDNETAQMLVKESAEKAGYTDVLYHGTKQFGFTEFDASKSDDKISFFVTGSSDIAQTYSGKKGAREIVDASSNVDGFSIQEVADRLNEEAKTDPNYGYSDFTYKVYNTNDVNNLITKVNNDIESVKALVKDEIKRYADVLANDYDLKTHGVQQQLERVYTILDKYQYDNISTPIYMLLHHTDAFRQLPNSEYSQIVKLEENVRLMNQLRKTDTADGVIVQRELDGYSFEILTLNEAKENLSAKRSSGNYALYGKPGKQLVVDGKGAYWNSIEFEPLDNGYTASGHVMWGPKKSTTREISSYAKEQGYDSVKIINIIDNGGRGEDTDAGDIYIYFNPNNLKSADPVTYDDKGNVIPLSERFNEDKKDIRYSLSSEDAQAVKHGDYHVTGDDVRFAPVREDIAKKSQNKAQKSQKLSIAPPLRKDITPQEPADVVHGEDVDATGDDIADEPVSITTVKKRLEANLQNATTELENNKKHREESIERINSKIANYQAMYESKKNKDTQVANNILRSIERLKNNRDNITAQYDKRINDIEKRIDKLNGQLQKDHSKQDNLERALKRIDKRLEREKQELIDAFNLQKGEIEKTTADKDAFVSKKAYELYRELCELRKGVKASRDLGAMLDYGPDWGELKRSLLDIKASPGKRVNEDSSVESIAREIITTAYEDELYSVDESYAELKKQLDELDAEAEKDRQRAREFSARKKKQEQYEQEVSDLIGDTSTWRDKPLGILYQITTLKRNLRDVVRKEDGSQDIKRADRIYEYLQGSYNRNEAELKRESNEIKKVFLDMKINKYESEYIQMLGELRYYPGTTLTRDVTDAFYEQHKKKIDVDKVEKAITESRKVYDDLIQRVNTVLKEQGMKEIPYIKGYYPHFTKDKQGLLGKLLNWKTVNNDIPTDIAGLTEMFTPVRTYQSFNKHREARETDYDFAQGFDTYVHGALDWIYHIEDIQRRRTFENVIRYIHSEDGLKKKVDEIKNNTGLDADDAQELINKAYENSKNPLGNFVIDLRNSTNNLAGKKSTRDRNMEYNTNRHIYSTMTNISNRVNANQVAGSISSAISNFIPITQSWGEVNPVYSLAAAKDAIRNALKDDGMINKSTFMTNRLLEEENLKKNGWDIAGEKLSLLMNVADHFTTEVVWRSKYLQNLQNGMSESEAIDDADIFAENVMAGRSRGNMPTIFNSKNIITKVFTSFQLEVVNNYGYMFKDMPQNIGKENINKLVFGYTKMFVGAFAFNALYSALTGRDAAFDPIGIIVDLCKDLGLGADDEEEESDVFGAVRNLGENIAQEIPFVGGLLGGGRVPISSALPYELKLGELWDDLEGWMTSENPETYRNRFIKEFTKPLYYLAMPMGGGQLKKSVEGLKMFDDDLPVSGSYTDSGKLRFPVEDTLGNKVQAAVFGQYASENAREYFEGGHAPLTEKQTQEFIDIDVPIADYWKYREGLKGLETTEDKFDYVNSLNLPVSKKNILINNLVDRKEPVDLENYSDFSSLEEFDYSVKNPGKYAVSKVTGGYDSYKSYTKALSDIEGDTDNFGKTISGSRKQNVAKYISGLDADYYTKIILFKSEYNSDHRYDYEIVTHLNSRNDLTYDEKVKILTELGFTVGPNGNIGWE